jgi:chorismate synthase
MSANSFGQRFVVTSFGESHGPALGVVVDGCPAGVPFSLELLRHELSRRRPGALTASGESITSARAESDEPEVLSGVYEGVCLGTPIAMLVRNQDARPKDYAEIDERPRVGHADDVWRAKFGHVDPRGGGRSSGRETVTRVMAGAVAQMMLRTLCPSIRVRGFARQIGPLELSDAELVELWKKESLPTAQDIDAFPARLPAQRLSTQVTELLVSAKREGRSYGGLVELWLSGVPASLGQPVFHKLKADLAAAMLSVGATASVEIGDGIAAAQAEGTAFHGDAERPERYGGIRGGISTGERIVLRVACKPTASVLHVARAGRHDPCIVPRAIPVLEAMAYLVLADHVLWRRTDRLSMD